MRCVIEVMPVVLRLELSFSDSCCHVEPFEFVNDAFVIKVDISNHLSLKLSIFTRMNSEYTGRPVDSADVCNGSILDLL